MIQGILVLNVKFHQTYVTVIHVFMENAKHYQMIIIVSVNQDGLKKIVILWINAIQINAKMVPSVLIILMC